MQVSKERNRAAGSLPPEYGGIVDRAESVVGRDHLDFRRRVEDCWNTVWDDFVGGIDDRQAPKGSNRANVANMDRILRGSRNLDETGIDGEGRGVEASWRRKAHTDFS